MSTGMTRDLSEKMQRDLGGVLERNLAIFSTAQSPHECSLILLEAAVMLSRTTAATIAGFGEEEQVPTLYQETIGAIIEELRRSTPEGVARTLDATRKRRAA